jgi:hypothetical protein
VVEEEVEESEVVEERVVVVEEEEEIVERVVVLGIEVAARMPAWDVEPTVVVVAAVVEKELHVTFVRVIAKTKN